MGRLVTVGTSLQDLLTSRHFVDSFGSIYTPGPLTNGITSMFSPVTTFDTFYFKNPDPFLVASLQCAVNSPAEDFFKGLHSYSHLGGTALTVGSYDATLSGHFYRHIGGA